MNAYAIEKLDLREYERCNEIWDMSACEFTEKFRREIECGNRVVFIYKKDGKFLGELAYVLDMQDPDYTLPKQRVYLSRLIVQPAHRRQGIATVLLRYVLDTVRKMGFTEASIGVDKDNEAALALYRKEGFTECLFEGEDEYGAFYKLMKRL